MSIRFKRTARLFTLTVIGFYILHWDLVGSLERSQRKLKMLRDDNGELSEERKEGIVKELGDILWYVAAMARDLEVPLNKIAEMNIQKLKSRQERGCLKGDGDNR